MSRPEVAAAKRSGANILDAVAYQKSPSLIVPTCERPTSVRVDAARRAPGQVRAVGKGDHAVAGRPVTPIGSKQWTDPWVDRWAMVWSSRSPFTLAATTGPSHPRMAGTAKPLVLRDWVGPNTRTDCDRSAATRRLPTEPSTSRPAGGGRFPPGTTRPARSAGRAHRAVDDSV